MDCEDDPYFGRQSTVRKPETVAKVHELVARDRQMSLKLMENQLHGNQETTHRED